MKDFFGNPLNIGDVVAFNPPRYKGLTKGTVTKFAPQMVEVEYNHQGYLYLTKVYPRNTVKSPCYSPKDLIG